jgi:hypothetical protein
MEDRPPFLELSVRFQVGELIQRVLTKLSDFGGDGAQALVE